ncbi:MAG: hypothetical protein ACE5GE_07170 [Phycisphaerae bacterium]
MAVACGVMMAVHPVAAQVTAPDPILFSTEQNFIATTGDHVGQIISEGDELSSRGQVINTNADLMGAFCPMPGTTGFGLDALHHRPDGLALFSTELGWFDECRGLNISPGDLLAGDGTIVKTNADLIANFNPQPVAPNVGLDAVFELPGGQVYFSMEMNLFDEVLGVLLKHGDLLSDAGFVVRTNQQLLANFCPMPVVGDFGLDAVHLVGNGEIWFSTETGWFDECLGVQISDGDLLSDAGYVVSTNQKLLAGFVGLTTDIQAGLDAAWTGCLRPFRGCGLLQIGPQGCPILVTPLAAYVLENAGGFAPGDRVWVEGCINDNSTICSPLTLPGIEGNTIGGCFEGCGDLMPGPQGCPVLVSQNAFYFLENTGGFQFGDRVFVRGCLNPNSLICPPLTGLGIESNDISANCPSCQALAARSCRDHNGRRLCLDMMQATVEPRLGGIRSLEIDLDDATGFAGDVTVACLDAADSVILNPADAVVDGNTIHLTFNPPIVDDTCHVLLDCGASVCVRSLHGDISRNGRVTTGDASILRFFFNQDPAVVGPQYDFDTNGLITTGDFSQIRFFFNNTVPICP